MSRDFDNTKNADLRAKIDDAKRRLPLPDLMSRLGLGGHAKKSAHCPFPGHEDKHESFSVFEGDDGFWHWNCFAGCGDGDEIILLTAIKLAATVSLVDRKQADTTRAAGRVHRGKAGRRRKSEDSHANEGDSTLCFSAIL